MHDLMRNAKPAHSTNPNRFKTDCPFCGKSQHFHFDLQTRRGICFVCMDKSIKLGDDYNLGKDQRPSRTLDELRESLSKVCTVRMMPSEIPGIDINRYVTEERGLSVEDIKRYDIRSGKSFKEKETDRVINKWCGRVVFPFYEGERCAYAIGRTYMGNERKYINVDVPKTDIVYGVDLIKNKECIICEGFLSAIAAERYTGISSVCLLGKTISPMQLYKIRNKVDRVWLSLDGGVPEKQIRFISRKLLKAGFEEVWKVLLPGKGDFDLDGKECEEDYDPDDLGEEYIRYFDKAVKVKYF